MDRILEDEPYYGEGKPSPFSRSEKYPKRGFGNSLDFYDPEILENAFNDHRINKFRALRNKLEEFSGPDRNRFRTIDRVIENLNKEKPRGSAGWSWRHSLGGEAFSNTIDYLLGIRAAVQDNLKLILDLQGKLDKLSKTPDSAKSQLKILP